MEHDVLLCYNRHDAEAAGGINKALQARGLRIWFDTEALVPGDDWLDKLADAIKTVPVAVVLVGPAGFGAWEESETKVLLNQTKKRRLRLVPVLLPGAPSSSQNLFLEQYSWLDLRADLTDHGLEKLVQAIRMGLPRLPRSKKGITAGPTRHNLPMVTLGSLFKGREAVLKGIERSLTPKGQVTAIVQQHVVHGLGGIGKTRLAVEYAWRYGHRYSHVLYVPANTRDLLFDAFIALGKPSLLDLDFSSANSDETRHSKVLQWLADNDKWLMILDNVDTEDARSSILSLLPLLVRGRVIITSRRKSWPAAISRRDLDLLSLKDSIKFLLQRTELDRKTDAADSIAAEKLATILGGLPLALEQAAAYINYHQITFLEYLSAWELEKENVLAWYDPAAMQYEEAIATTWQASFRLLQPLAMTVLQVAAFLPPEPVPQKLFQDGADLLRATCHRLYSSKTRDLGPLSIAGAISQLVDLSLATRDTGTLSVHRLVQEIVRGRASTEERRICVKAAVDLVEIAKISSLPPRPTRTYREPPPPPPPMDWPGSPEPPILDSTHKTIREDD